MTRPAVGSAVTVVGVAIALLAACGAPVPGVSAASPTPSLGAVAIPYPTPAPIPTVGPGRPALVAMGDPVAVTTGADTVLLTARGPDLAVQEATPTRTAPGTVVVIAHGPSAEDSLQPGRFAFADELDRPVPFTAEPPAPPSQGDPMVTFHATFAEGHTVLHWTGPDGQLITWDFQVELD